MFQIKISRKEKSQCSLNENILNRNQAYRSKHKERIGNNLCVKDIKNKNKQALRKSISNRMTQRSYKI